MANFSASDDDSNTKKNKKSSKNSKEREDNSKKRCKNTSLYCSLHVENNSHTSGDCKVLKARASYKDNPKYGKKYYKKKSK